MSTVVSLNQDNTVIASGEPNNNIVVSVPDTITVISGLMGPPGPPGESTLGGYSVDLNNVASGDLLLYSGDSWINTPKENLTDAGNF